MNAPESSPALNLTEGRFARLEAIPWWDQTRLSEARVLVIGAGALGNEVLKNLALLGVGHIAIADLDHVELSNLSRSALYRESDEGLPKAECAARAVRSIHPRVNVTPLNLNVLAGLGLGWFHWADVVIGALDNREARVFVNSACARVGKPWVDGGIEVLQGIARGFHPPHTACYECTMSQVDWDLLDKRRSCSLLARRAIAERGTPTTPTTASIIGGIQVQEVVKLLHGLPAMVGKGFVFEGAMHQSYPVAYAVNPDCPWHGPMAELIVAQDMDSATPLAHIAEVARTHLGGLDAIDFSREIVQSLDCVGCGSSTEVWRAADHLHAFDLHCGSCGQEAAPRFAHSLGPTSPAFQRCARELGLPLWDILWPRYRDQSLGIVLGGDRAHALAPL